MLLEVPRTIHRFTGVISEGDPKFELKLEGLDGIAVKYYPDVPADAHKSPIMFSLSTSHPNAKLLVHKRKRWSVSL